jgi:hypothetical protein
VVGISVKQEDPVNWESFRGSSSGVSWRINVDLVRQWQHRPKISMHALHVSQKYAVSSSLLSMRIRLAVGKAKCARCVLRRDPVRLNAMRWQQILTFRAA